MIKRFFIIVTIFGLMFGSVVYGQNTHAEGQQIDDKQYDKALKAANLADSYYRNGYVEAAVENYKVFIDWCKQKYGDKYILGKDYLYGREETVNESVIKYISFLQAANRYEKVLNYCNEIKQNPNFNGIAIDTSDYLEKLWDKKNIVLTISKNPEKRIDPFDYRYDDELYLNINNDGVDYCIPYIYSIPKLGINDQKLADIWHISDNRKQINALVDYLHNDIVAMYTEWFGSDIYTGVYNTTNEMKSFEDTIIAIGKNFWDEDGMGFEPWISCCRLAALYYDEKDYDNAVKWQQLATDIVEIPRDTNRLDNIEYSILSYNLDNDNILITHINVEFFNLYQLAYYSLFARQFQKSLEYYTRAVDMYLQVLQMVFKGSDLYKEQVWEKHKKTLSNTVGEIIEGCQEYPSFGNLVLELSAMQKGFLAWQKIALMDAVGVSNSIEANNIYDKKTDVENNIELSYYNCNTTQYNRAELYSNQADAEEELRSIVGSSHILEKTIVGTDEIKQSLASNDVYVDFVEVPLGDTINSANRISDKRFKFVTSPKMIEAKYEHCFYYAVLMRKNWDYPKVIYIGENIDSPLNDLIVYKLNGRDKKTEVEQVGVVNSIYMDTVLTHYIWDKIVSAGSIKEGDNIFYVPTGLLTKIGLENLSYGENALVSDRYKVYRLSSARELLKKKSRIDCGKDICYGIGDLKYNDTKFAIDKNRKRSTAVSSMFSRDSLPPLLGSRAELAFLEETFGASATVTSGTAGTESHVLREINRLKPAVLHIGTHGFNCIDEELSAEEERFLFGDRDSYVSPMENSLYRTGLYMSAQKSGNSGNASEGIITAKEISMLDLSQTKLVVLSSCSSALGSVNSEGVYGLQRGLKLAGAESLLVSLWDVNDKSTELLMKEFYRQLLLGKTRREALLKAQEAVRNYDGDMNDNDIGEYRTFAAPYYWAGFVLIDGNE